MLLQKYYNRLRHDFYCGVRAVPATATLAKAAVLGTIPRRAAITPISWVVTLRPGSCRPLATGHANCFPIKNKEACNTQASWLALIQHFSGQARSNIVRSYVQFARIRKHSGICNTG